MNQKNFEYLSNQLKYTGFGEALLPKLKEAMEKGDKEFTLGHTQDYGKDSTAAVLHFKSQKTVICIFFNKYNFLLKMHSIKILISHSIYINNNQQNITFQRSL